VRKSIYFGLPAKICRFLCPLGLETYPAGRIDEAASPPTGLSASLRQAGFELGRLKTGTPPRLARSSIKWDQLEVQLPDSNVQPFSYLTKRVTNQVSPICALLILFSPFEDKRSDWDGRQDNQISCFKTHTTPNTHNVIRDNLHMSVHIRETVKGVVRNRRLYDSRHLTGSRLQVRAIALPSRAK
jgi:tRNA uridine 5-carboxymethylaminomethyl modification enzyme